MPGKKIILTVTNNLRYDQRMQRICSSLAAHGYQVTLIGRSFHHDVELAPAPYQQVRIPCRFKKGKAFYLEFQIKLLWKLLFSSADAICAIDLDTIMPVYVASRWHRIPRLYDAHELFCEMKEIVTRPAIYRVWKAIERKMVPAFQWGYTVNQPIADIFFKLYQVRYAVIRNMPVRRNTISYGQRTGYIYYQGAVNEGRCFESLIPAMKWVDRNFIICGDGNFFQQAQELARVHGVQDKIQFKGMVAPEELLALAAGASVGITLFEASGTSNYLSLANRYFDYIQFGLPQLCVDYPVYRALQSQFATALLIQELSPENIAASLNKLLLDPVLYQQLQEATLSARQVYCWEEEEKTLISVYQNVFANHE
jgi:glycosyltransferase involved in cell wall biosynthesis